MRNTATPTAREIAFNVWASSPRAYFMMSPHAPDEPSAHGRRAMNRAKRGYCGPAARADCCATRKIRIAHPAVALSREVSQTDLESSEMPFPYADASLERGLEEHRLTFGPSAAKRCRAASSLLVSSL